MNESQLGGLSRCNESALIKADLPSLMRSAEAMAQSMERPRLPEPSGPAYRIGQDRAAHARALASWGGGGGSDSFSDFASGGSYL